MIVAFRDHRGMGIPYARALVDHGHTVVDYPAPADVALVDHDYADRHESAWLEGYPATVVYPHGGGPLHDRNTRPAPANVVWRFTPKDIGWAYCDTEPFTRLGSSSVVFAPYHGNDSEGMQGEQEELFWQLRKRYGQALSLRTLDSAPSVYSPGWHDTTTASGTVQESCDYLIDRAPSLVVAAPGTFPTIAVALGIPTIIYGQHWLAPFGTYDLDTPYPWNSLMWVEHALDHEAVGYRREYVGHRSWSPYWFVAEFEAKVAGLYPPFREYVP